MAARKKKDEAEVANDESEVVQGEPENEGSGPEPIAGIQLLLLEDGSFECRFSDFSKFNVAKLELAGQVIYKNWQKEKQRFLLEEKKKAREKEKEAAEMAEIDKAIAESKE